MKKLFILGLSAMALTLGLFLASCASLFNFLDPIYAINRNGEKVEAARGSGQTVKIEGAEYQYADRPSVPAAPQKPVSPGNPPLQPTRPANPTGETTIYYSGGGKKFYWKDANELREILKLPPDPNSRVHMQDQLDDYLQKLNQYNADVATYQNRVTQHQQNTAKYQQDLAKYNKDIAEYNAKLPQYTTTAEKQAKTIQNKINPNAPENWVGYVTGKYLLYKGKAK